MLSSSPLLGSVQLSRRTLLMELLPTKFTFDFPHKYAIECKPAGAGSLSTAAALFFPSDAMEDWKFWDHSAHSLPPLPTWTLVHRWIWSAQRVLVLFILLDSAGPRMAGEDPNPLCHLFFLSSVTHYQLEWLCV
ncbi:hypothetical protein LOK49_LG03G03585 [Camellia lanceoleosa]|uniref:Uncharacterized protein n=1 Tax=Camellia lanceoleosa TaxID=1840588 RepID=A0ACC0IHM3_9ERIC|nr:hypothetical protein LOK49_LG03G03585 [Camellia lanceoleosa]